LIPIEEDDVDADGSILVIEEELPLIDLTDDASE